MNTQVNFILLFTHKFYKVRSNENREVGFLADQRRINVAVTRAKRHIAIICDPDTCSSDKFLSRLINYISDVIFF